MTASSLITKNPAIIAGLVLGGVLVLWIAGRGARQTGVDLGRGAADVAAGAAFGVLDGINEFVGTPTTSEVIGWANSSSNPLQPAGAWLGGKIYDWTH